MEITINISRSAVMEEVAQTTSYTGAKMEDKDALDRVAVVDEDEKELARFWDESRAELSQSFIRLLSSEGMKDDGDTYELRLNVSVSFDNALLPSMAIGLFSYFVQNITGKWYVYCNKPEASAYTTGAKGQLNEVKEKAFFKKKPTRPTYS